MRSPSTVRKLTIDVSTWQSMDGTTKRENLRQQIDMIVPHQRQRSVPDAPIYDQQNVKEMRKSRFMEWGSYSTVHGVGRISAAQVSLFRRAVWLLCLLASLTLIGYQMHSQITLFFSYPVAQKQTVVKPNQLVFPAVTVCNQNQLDMSTIENSPELMEIIALYEEIINNPIVADYHQLPTNPTERLQYMRAFWGITLLEQAFKDSGNSTGNDWLTKYKYLPTVSGREETGGRDPRMSFGHSWSSMLVSCTWKGDDCTPFINEAENTHYWFHGQYGACTTMNIKGTMINSLPGPIHGLSLILYIHADQYAPELTPSSGARVTVHHNNEMPLPEDFGIDTPPGVRASIALTQTQFNRLGAPYGECINSSSEAIKANITNLNMWGDYKDYSISTCQKTALQRLLIRECGCQSYEYPRPDGYEVGDITTFCNGNVLLTSLVGTEEEQRRIYTLVNQMEACAATVFSSIRNGSLTFANCTETCQEVKYEPVVTYSQWPTPTYQEALFAAIGSNQNLGRDALQLLDEARNLSSAERADPINTVIQKLRNNFLQVDIYYKEISYLQTSEEESYGRNSLIGDIGGYLGFYAGISIMSVFEILELILDIIFCVRVKTE